MKQLNIENILSFHLLVIKRSGGSDGVRDMGRLEAAIAAQSQEVFEVELYPTLFEKAAALLRGIIGDHPFVDGNKRTAMLSALTLIELNSYAFQAKKGELEDFAVRVAVERLDVPIIAAWLKAHSKKHTTS